MATVTQIAQTMRTLLTTTAETAARTTGCVQRRSKLSGAALVQTLVLGWLHRPAATLHELTQTAASLGVVLTPQALHQRFTAPLAACLAQVLETAVHTVIMADPVAIPVLQRFPAVVVQDSSTITLPAALASIWDGGGGRPAPASAAVKLQVRWDLGSGRLQGPVLQEGRRHDRQSPWQTAPLPPGALRLADLGFFSLDVLRDLARQGSYFLSRLQGQTAVFAGTGQRLDLGRWLPTQGLDQVDVPVQMGAQHRLPVRLVAARVPDAVAAERRRRLKADARRRGQMVSQAQLQWADWTILVTNTPGELLAPAEVLVLARVRWQIELLFKLWKQHGQIDEWRSTQPGRILCELYAKLIAVVVQHWLFLVSCWRSPDRSLVKAAQTVRSYALLLASAFAGVLALETAITQVARCIAAGCRMNPRRTAPNTYQLLLALEEVA